MSITTQSRFGKKRFIPLVIYTGVLCLSAQAYGFLAEYELFMQTLNTLFPLIALVGLLVLSIACALLLLSPAPLWLGAACPPLAQTAKSKGCASGNRLRVVFQKHCRVAWQR